MTKPKERKPVDRWRNRYYELIKMYEKDTGEHIDACLIGEIEDFISNLLTEIHKK